MAKKLMFCERCSRVFTDDIDTCPNCVYTVDTFSPKKLKPILILFLFLITLSFSQAALTDGLLGYWNLTSYTDSSRDPLTCANFGVTFTTGKLGNGGDFESGETDDIQCKEGTGYDLTNTYTFNFWLKLESVAARQVVFVKDIETGGGSSGYWMNLETSVTGCTTGYCLCELDSGVERDCYDAAMAAGSTYTMYTVMRNTTHMKWYINGTLKETDARTTNALTNNHNISIGRLPNGASNFALDGILDELGIWNRTLTEAEVSQLYYGGTGCDAIANPSGCSAPADTTPPSITLVKQSPLNASILNLATTHLKINATITDAVKVKNANLTLRLNNTAVYFNGTQVNINATYNNMSTLGTVFRWEFDEQNLLGGTYPGNFSKYFEDSTHINATLSGANNLIKMKFFNVNNKIQSNFYEIYAINTTPTGTTYYFYCNSSYTTGNPSVNNNCVNFYTTNINRPLNHTHGKSQHKIIPMGINTTTGKIGDVLVTPESYIIKKVTPGSELVFYVSTVFRADQSQTSSNNGVTWSNLAGTYDSHIHQTSTNPKASLNYRICAQDNATGNGNTACTVWYGDIFENPILPPNAVDFYKPILDGTYNSSIMINFTQSFSASGQNIINYTISYAEENSTSFTDITVLNHPTTYYSWNIEAIPNDRYYLKVVIRDSLRQSTTSYSDSFNIYNPPTLSEVLLQEIVDGIDELISTITELIGMLWLVILYLGLMFFGFWVIKSGNVMPGMVIIIGTLGFDLYFIQKIYTDYVAGKVTDSGWQSVFIWIFGLSLGLWLFVKLTFIIGSRFGTYKKQ